MSSKPELIARLEGLLAQGNVEQRTEAVEQIREAYEAATAALQLEAVELNGTEAPAATEEVSAAEDIPIENATPRDEDDRRFKQLLDAFNQKVNEALRRKAEQELANLSAKRAVMDELRALITNEENIGTAFQRFGELQERWKAIGPVPAQAFRELQRDYGHLRDEFFYHIRIYQELRDHDLRKNTALKLALIADMEAVVKVDDVRTAEQLVKEYQERWHQVGPVVREEWEAIRDRFWSATRQVYERIHEHYKARRAEQEARIDAKKGLTEKVRAITAHVLPDAETDWRALTEQVLEVQNAWKTTGQAGRRDNERLWKEFRAACNEFFDRKKAHFAQLRDRFKVVRDRKQALLEQAVALKESTEWRATADKLKALQAQWKEAGFAGPHDDQKLWWRFNQACNAFFNARKAHFEQQDAELEHNVKAREELIDAIAAFGLSGERGRDLASLKSFSERWLNAGRVPPQRYDELAGRYRAALDGLYGKLKVNEEERREMRFKDHIDGLKIASDAHAKLDRESRTVKRKIQELEDEVRQFEDRMGMFNFKTAAGEAMKKEMEKKMDRTRREIERLRTEHRQLQQELR